MAWSSVGDQIARVSEAKGEVMIWAQIMSGGKLHLACEAGEEFRGEVIRAGYISAPLCGTSRFKGEYRMTCNLPLAHACKRCCHVHDAMRKEKRT